MKISAIEVAFAIPVELTREQERRLSDLIQEIAKANEPEGHVHWLFGQGHKPQFSQADARFLGRPVDPTAPEADEPTFDDSVHSFVDLVLSFETSCRERYEGEK